MRKALVLATSLLLMILSIPATTSLAKTPALPAAVVEAGNQFCPVSGDKVSGKHFVEYNGKRYGLCCKMCANKFKKDPSRYIMKMAAQEANPDAAHVHHDHMH